MRFKTLSACAPFYILAAIFCLIAAFSFLWFLSSSDLNFALCDGTYSLSTSKTQCRHPAITADLFATTALLSIVFLIAGIIKERRGKTSGSKSFLVKFVGYGMAGVIISVTVAAFIFFIMAAYQNLSE